MRSVLAPFILVLGLADSWAQQDSGWKWLSPQPQGNDLEAVAWHDKQSVAVGALGTILEQHDGSGWAVAPSGTRQRLVDVRWTGSGWLAASAVGELLTSRDGRAWDLRLPELPGTGPVVRAGVLRSSTILLRGRDVLTTTDFSRWESYQVLEAGTLVGLATCGRGAVAVGPGGRVASSSDGQRWKSRSIGTAEDIVAVVWGQDRFVAVGAMGTVWLSPSGDSWVKSSETLRGPCRALGWVGDRFVAVGTAGLVAESRDGVTWNPLDAPSEGYELRGVAGPVGKGVAVGRAGTILAQDSSPAWHVATARYCQIASGLAWDGRQWVAAVKPPGGTVGGMFQLATSPDGLTWKSDTRRPLGFAAVMAAAPNGTLVVVDEQTVHTRLPDGTWVSTPAPANPINRVRWGGGRFVAVGVCGTTIQSQDGTTWRHGDVPTPLPLWDVAWSGTHWVAVGSWKEASWYPACRPSTDAAIFTSGDGTTWTRQATGYAGHVPLQSIACSPSGCVAVSADGRHAFSADGLAWRAAQQQDVPLLDVAWTGSAFVAGGPDGRVAASEDGSAWQVVPAMTDASLSLVAARDGQVLVGGENGVLIEGSSPSLRIPRRRLQGTR